MTFKSTKIEKKGKDNYVIQGDFTLKGVTKRIEFPFTFTGAIKDPWGNTRFGIEAQTKINRREYGINYAPVPAGVYQLDPAHSLIGFAVRHLEINLVSGRFKDFTGSIDYNDRDVTKSTVEFKAKVAGIDT